jgi:hypothetical protein
MPGDSVSTFLDITATQAAASSAGGEDPEVVRRAEALAKISSGVTSMDALVGESDLSEPEASDAVKWLEDNGLVDVQARTDGAHLGLTSIARNALE